MFIRATAAGLVALAAASPARAQNVEPFYAGKTINLIVGYPPGGSNDTNARVLSTHLGEHLPGKPSVVIQNMPGAGSFVAVNYLSAIAPKDGTALGLGAPTLAIDEKLGTPGVRYKTSALNWIGRVNSLVNIVMMWKTSPIKTLADAEKRQATLAGTGAGSTSSIYPNVLNHVVGTKFKLVMGYRGSSDAMLAMERGETEGHSTAWEAVKTAHPDWIKNGDISVLVQFSLKRHPDLPDTPTAIDAARNDDERRVLSAIMAASEVGTAIFAPPGLPPERVATLRKAFDETMSDPAYRADLDKVRLGFAPMSGDDLQAALFRRPCV